MISKDCAHTVAATRHVVGAFFYDYTVFVGGEQLHPSIEPMARTIGQMIDSDMTYPA